ncbi:beta strand repeat-containing protein, partial [Chloroflexota bacterium]
MKKKISRILGVGLVVALLGSMILAAAPVSATVSQPSVTVSPNSISNGGIYTIKFDTYFPLVAATDTITVTFPSGTIVPATITAGQVTVDNAGGASPTVATVVTSNATLRTAVVTVPAGEGTTAASHMEVEFSATSGIINPSAPGTAYTLQVKTSQETTNVTSKDYVIEVPGRIDRYNKEGNFVGAYSTITLALAAVNDYDVLKLGTGTYTESPTIAVGADHVKIETMGTAADTTIKGTLTLNGTFATIDDITIKGVVVVGGASNTIQNSVITKASTTSGIVPMVDINAGTTTIKNSTIDTSGGSVIDTAIDVGASTTLSDCTIVVDQDSSLNDDTAIDATAAATVKVTNCTITGSSGYGFVDNSVAVVVATISGSTFDGLEKAIVINNATALSAVTIRGNTIKNSSSATTSAITITLATAVTMDGNTLIDNLGYSVDVAANANLVTMVGNNISGSGKGLRNTDAVNTLTCEMNWWGGTSGPTISSNVGGTGETITATGTVDYKPWIEASAASSRSAAATLALDASTTVGISYVATAGAGTVVLTNYTENPVADATPYTALAGGYFDIYAPSATGTVTIKLYADGITADTDAYVFSPLQGKWVACSDQGASGTGEYVFITAKATGSTPLSTDLGGTVFALVTGPATADTTLGSPVIQAPAPGGIDVALMPTFYWDAVEDAKAYDLQVSINFFYDTLEIDRQMLAQNTYGVGEMDKLTYDTTYYWRVRATTHTLG